MSTVLLLVAEICQGISVIVTRKRTRSELFQYLSMVCICLYVSLVYGPVKFYICLVVAGACAILVKDAVYIMATVMCLCLHLLSTVVVLPTAWRVTICDVLFTVISALMMAAIFCKKKKM